ncbi:MAG: glycosyltransferase family 2 protein [Cyclobacteriaceae bacterium]|nr:glycosyltransferase family 2 protein [Cyclobacteriaceae bacterium]
MSVKFSIIIPTYNRADRILSSIQSAFDQHYSDFEIIIIDDGSADNTEQVISSIQDPRIKYFKKKMKSGPSRAILAFCRLLGITSLFWIAMMNCILIT